MKKYLLLALALGLMTTSVTCPVFADDEAEDATEEKVLKPGQYPAQKAAAKLRTFGGKVNKKADYYIYLQSASWCGPCQAEMPDIAKAYAKMKRSKRVDLILVSWDENEGAAKGFAKQHRGRFPIVMKDNEKVADLKGFKQANGIPFAIIVDKEGKVVKSGHGSIVKDWEDYCPEIEEEDED
ncbi:MAG: TlpA disulfide reductase family protein [Akkermansia sp.]